MLGFAYVTARMINFVVQVVRGPEESSAPPSPWDDIETLEKEVQELARLGLNPDQIVTEVNFRQAQFRTLSLNRLSLDARRREVRRGLREALSEATAQRNERLQSLAEEYAAPQSQ